MQLGVFSTGGALFGCRCEREAQFGQSAQQERRVEVVLAVIRRSMRMIVDRDISHAVEDALDRDPAFRPRKWRTGTRVDAAAERHVLTGYELVGPPMRFGWR